MASPGSPANMIPAGEDWMPRRVKAVEDGLREGMASIATSFGPAMAQLVAQQAATDANVASIAANVAKINTLISQVVAPGALYGSAQNFAVTTTETARASITVTVPAGFTQAAVSVTGSVYAINPNTTGPGAPPGQDYLYARPTIAGHYGYELPMVVLGANSSGLHVGSFATVLSGLTPGSTFAVTVTAMSSFANWAANVVNTAEISGSVLWIK